MGRPNLSRETKSSGANEDREKNTFLVQLTTSRIDNLPIDPYSALSHDHAYCT